MELSYGSWATIFLCAALIQIIGFIYNTLCELTALNNHRVATLNLKALDLFQNDLTSEHIIHALHI